MMTKIIQITDSHLSSKEHDLFQGVPVYQRLQNTLAEAIKFSPDYILLTGDLSQDGSVASYQLLKKALQFVTIPIYIIPGNHDFFEPLKAVLSPLKPVHFEQTLNFDDWSFFLMNTVIENVNYGELSTREINRFKQFLKETKANNLGVAMHHPPILIGGDDIDSCMLLNNDKFFDCIASEPRIKLVITGHVHNSYTFLRNHITYQTGIASSVQYRFDHEGKSHVDLHYGFTEYYFSKDITKIHTHICSL